jgi:hypothetical protein
VHMAALTNQVFVGSSLSKFHADQGNALANSYAAMVEQAIAKVEAETAIYNNELVGGKWRNMMAATGINNNSSYRFRWPQPTKLATSTEQPAIKPVTLVTSKAIPAAPSFVENDGCVSIEAEHPTRNTARNGAQWQVIPGLGRSGDSVSVYPVTVPSIVEPAAITSQSPLLEYDFTTTSTGEAKITTYNLPTRRINDARGLRYAIAIDDAVPQIVDFNIATESDRRWSENVMRNASIDTTTHAIAATGKHTLKIWMVDPGVVMDKVVIDLGGAKASYLGPPETIVGN